MKYEHFSIRQHFYLPFQAALMTIQHWLYIALLSTTEHRGVLTPPPVAPATSC